jgi:hypothetical protein
VGILMFALMTTWRRGSELLGQAFRAQTLPLDLFMKDLERRNRAAANNMHYTISAVYNRQAHPLAPLESAGGVQFEARRAVTLGSPPPLVHAPKARRRRPNVVV